MILNCTWCQKREAAYRIKVYELEKRKGAVANNRSDNIQYVDGPLYVTVTVCQACLPVVKESDSLMGRNKKKPTNV